MVNDLYLNECADHFDDTEKMLLNVVSLDDLITEKRCHNST